jgi:hypothetical protein
LCYIGKKSIIREIKSRRMRWAGHVARMGKREVHKGFCWGDLREGGHFGDPGLDGRKILKWVFKKWDGAWAGLSWFRIGTGGWALVNAVMNSHKMWGTSLLADKL